jgi:DNA polymerase-4
MNLQPTYKIIFHIDMNCFFASCEIAEDKSLANKPIVVAHNDVFKKSIILTASYEARKFGIKTTMLIKDAIKLCPELVVVEPNFNLYQHYSQIFFNYLNTITNKIEVTSIDEGYLDVTEVCQSINAIDLANKIQKSLLEEHKLPCSIGIAPNKFLAKMASDMKKPLGITILRKRDIQEKLWPLPIGAMLGVGKKTQPKLEEIGVNTIGDIVKLNNPDLLKKTVGIAMSDYLLARANGIDNSDVDYYSLNEVSSISNAHTFNYNIINVKVMKDMLKVLSNSVSERLTSRNLVAQTIGIQIKYGNFTAINRSKGLEVGINNNLDLWGTVEEIFDDFYDEVSEVRLLGVFATRLSENKVTVKQYTIFDDIDKLDKEDYVNGILKKIKNQYGKDIINIGYYDYQKKDEEK